MALTSGFFNSVDHDRKYNANHIGRMFDGIITDGIFKTIGTGMVVTADMGNRLNIGIGRAWFNHTWSLNDAIEPIFIDPAEELMDRIDAVVLEVNTSDAIRANSYKVIKGTPATSPVKPTLTHTLAVNQYALAYVTVYCQASSNYSGVISQSAIENAVGTEETPWSSALVETIPADTIMQQWKTELDEFIASREADMLQYTTQQKEAFETWFESLETELSGDVAANLQIQINHKQAERISRTVELPSGEDRWISRTDAEDNEEFYIVMPVAGVRSDNDIQVAPDPSSFMYYGECIVRASRQSYDSLEFTASAVPEKNILVNVLIWN